MVTVPWVSSIFKSSSKKEDTSYSLDFEQSKRSIKHLVELTEQLDAMEDNIRGNEEFLRAVTDCLHVPIWVKDSKGHFIFVNISCAKVLLGTTVEKALHLTDADLKGSAIAKVCMESDRRVQKSLKTSRFIEHARYPNFDLWIDTTKLPLILKGELKGIVGSANIITQFVSKGLLDRYSEPGLVEIDVELKYCMDSKGGRRQDDIGRLLEEKNEVIGAFEEDASEL